VSHHRTSAVWRRGRADAWHGHGAGAGAGTASRASSSVLGTAGTGAAAGRGPTLAPSPRHAETSTNTASAAGITMAVAMASRSPGEAGQLGACLSSSARHTPCGHGTALRASMLPSCSCSQGRGTNDHQRSRSHKRQWRAHRGRATPVPTCLRASSSLGVRQVCFMPRQALSPTDAWEVAGMEAKGLAAPRGLMGTCVPFGRTYCF
jgi:hypothetical protein